MRAEQFRAIPRLFFTVLHEDSVTIEIARAARGALQKCGVTNTAPALVKSYFGRTDLTFTPVAYLYCYLRKASA
jgi:hypothetical protein